MKDCRESRKDYGGMPLVINIDREAMRNPFYRRALWTGEYLQVTLMTIPVNGDIGLEIHPDTDQFIRIESGCGMVKTGKEENNLNQGVRVNKDFAVMVPAGTWHNVINTGNVPLRLYSVYAPPHHPRGTVHETKKAAEEAGD